MRGMMAKFVGAAVFALVLAGAGAAQAVDSPKWVAAIYVQSQNSVGLRWGAVPGATGFKVLRSTTKGADYKEIASVTVPQAFDAAVEPGTTYYYVLQAVVGAEVSANSDERSVTIPGSKREALAAPELSEPIVQTTTEFGKTSFRVGLNWKVVPKAVAYNLYKSTESGKNFQLAFSGAENRYVDTQVEEGKTYYYVTTALDDQFQETPYSKEVSAAPKAEVRKEKKVVKAEVELVVQPTRLIRTLGRNDPGLEPLNNPSSVTVSPDGVVYVPDTVANRIRMYDAQGTLVKMFGQTGNGKNPGDLRMPAAIKYYDGMVYVTCPQLGFVQVFTADGTPRQPIVIKDPEIPDEALFVTTFAARADGTFYVSIGGKHMMLAEIDEKGVVQNRYKDVQLYDGSKAKYGGSSQMDFDSEGNLFLTSTVNFSVHAFDKDGANYLTWGTAGDVAGKFLRPVGLSVDNKNRVLVSDIATGNLQVFDAKTGDYLFALGGEKEGEALDISTPTGVDVGDDGLVYIAEGLLGQVAVLQPVGEPYKINLAKQKH